MAIEIIHSLLLHCKLDLLNLFRKADPNQLLNYMQKMSILKLLHLILSAI